MFAAYWHTWLPLLVAAGALLILGAAAAFGATGARRIAPPGMFVIAGLALGVLGASALLLADAAGEGDGVTTYDPPVWRAFVDARSPARTVLAKIVTEAGSTLAMTILASAAAILLWWRRSRGDAVMVAVTSIGAGLLVFVTKRVVGRQRPPQDYRLVDETNLSFPSGHALVSVAMLGVLTLVALPHLRATWARIALVLGALLFAVAIGLSRLYLGVHWATDVLGGWVVGLGWLLTVVTTRRLWRSFRDNQESGSPTHTDPGLTDSEPAGHCGALPQ